MSDKHMRQPAATKKSPTVPETGKHPWPGIPSGVPQEGQRNLVPAGDTVPLTGCPAGLFEMDGLVYFKAPDKKLYLAHTGLEVGIAPSTYVQPCLLLP